MPRSRHGRLPWLLPEQLPQAARRVYDSIVKGPRADSSRVSEVADKQGRLQGPFNAMLVAPEVGGPLQELGSAIRYRTDLSDRIRELVILAVAVHRRSEFEWYVHAAAGQDVGLTEQELLTLRQKRPPSSLSPAEDVAYRVSAELLSDHDLNEETFLEADKLLGHGRLTELVVLVGYYELLASLMEAFRTPLPDGVEPVFHQRTT